MRKWLALVGSGALIAVACSSFSSDDTGAPDTDGGAPDVSTVPPAPPSDAGAAPFCSTVDAQFCWSFDEGANPIIGPQLEVKGQAPGTTLTDAAFTPPGAMQNQIVDAAAYTGVSLVVGRDVTLLRCEADVLVEQAEPDSGAQVVLLEHDFEGSFFFGVPALLARREPTGGVRLQITPLGVASVDIGNAPLGVWTHVEMTSRLTNGQWVVSGQVKGGQELEVDAGPRDGGLPRFHPFFGVGSISTISWTVRHDNLVCRWE
jgi:hypothetical protein